KKKGRAAARAEFREETPRRRTAEPLTHDPYRTAQFRQRSPGVNPPLPEPLAGFGFPHSSAGTPRRRGHLCAAQAANRTGVSRLTVPPPLDRHSALLIDVDGTLLEIAPRPDQVEVPPGLPRLLDRLAGERDGALALISGRPIADLDRLFHPWHGAAAGLHGIERRRPDGSHVESGATPADAAAAALDRLRPELQVLARPR